MGLANKGSNNCNWKDNLIRYCVLCSKPFRNYRKKQRFCGHVCLGKANSGENSRDWKGGKMKHCNGYILVKHDGKNRLEHRVVMEKLLGRPLKEEEVVHHKNHNKKDNRIENLELMTRGEHSIHHTMERKNGKWAMKWAECQGCKTREVIHHARGYCKNCHYLKCYRK